MSKKAPQRSFRVDDDLWNKALEKAGLMSLSAIIRALLLAWVDGRVNVDVAGKVTVGDATQTD